MLRLTSCDEECLNEAVGGTVRDMTRCDVLVMMVIMMMMMMIITYVARVKRHSS